jgi:hypothetical protein
MSTTAEVIEGTWEEISLQAAKFNGRRLRVTLLPGEEQSDAKYQLPPTGRYATRIRADLLTDETTMATAEEIAEAERQMKELVHSLNENRRRAGAEPVF